jgi:hypothetical protein
LSEEVDLNATSWLEYQACNHYTSLADETNIKQRLRWTKLYNIKRQCSMRWKNR